LNLCALGEAAFAETALKSLKVPENVERLPAGVFPGSCLRRIELRRELKAIEALAFKGCKRLGGVVIPPSVGRFAVCDGFSDESAAADGVRELPVGAGVRVGKSNAPDCPNPIVLRQVVECGVCDTQAEEGCGALEFQGDVKSVDREFSNGDESAPFRAVQFLLPPAGGN
jgi:hypothetical protein